MRKIIGILIVIFLTINVGCSNGNNDAGEYSKYTYEFLDTFDTMIQLTAYTKNSTVFDSFKKKVHTRFQELHKLYDIYYDYKDINNIKKINDNAGIKPIKVDQEIIDILIFSKDWYNKTGKTVNIAFGPVLSIWHTYRTNALENPNNASIPTIEELKVAASKINIENVIIDEINNTVFLKKAGMSLDVGAIGKGFATEIIANEMIKEGYDSFIISSGGNVKVVGEPKDKSRSKWGIGIQEARESQLKKGERILDVVYISDSSVVSSGDYQRFYEVNGKKLHHLIDIKTLMPANFYKAVTVVIKDSAIADFLSTAIFLLPYEDSLALVESIENAEALWIMKDGSIKTTPNMLLLLKNMGGAVNK